jgi:hypothetical protein
VAEAQPRPERDSLVGSGETFRKSQDSFAPAAPIPVDTPVSMLLDSVPVQPTNEDATAWATPPTDYEG